MISHLRGQLIKKDVRSIVLDINGVGYKVFVSESVLDSLSLNTEISLWTHMAVREDAQDLYGFLDEETFSFFELLISISGIGPKGALNILNIATPKILRRAISSGDTTHLTKVSGIGQKIANKIVLELKDKFEAMDGDGESDVEHIRGESDAIEALKSLGYPEREARDVLKKIPDSESAKMTASEKVKRALKILGQK